MNFSSVCNLLKFQDKIDIGTSFANVSDFSFAPPVASDALSPDPSRHGT